MPAAKWRGGWDEIREVEDDDKDYYRTQNIYILMLIRLHEIRQLFFSSSRILTKKVTEDEEEKLQVQVKEVLTRRSE